MLPLDDRPILTAAAMRAAEEASGIDVDTLMARAGRAVAEAVRRIGGGQETLILCGPSNNGGDGYVAAAALRGAGVPVRIAAATKPHTDAARRARAGWGGPVEQIADAQPAPVLVDALFGTGLSRALDLGIAAPLHRLVADSRLAIAVDLPSGVDADTGAAFGDVPRFALTLVLGAAKPAHLLQPAARHCGAVRVLDIGVPIASDARVLAPPSLPEPGPDSHKFNRGTVAVIRGRMSGAAHLAATASMHAGAGYVSLLGASMPGEPHALVRRPLTDEALADPRIGALVIGPGLGRDDAMRELVGQALATDHPLVIDGDALRLVTPEQLAGRAAPIILTPHAGEFDGLFGEADGSKIDRTRLAASRAQAVIVHKGPDTVIAAPDGQVRIAGDASDWLSTAGSGDVLAGAIAACVATRLSPLDAAAAGVWLHREAARRLGRAFIADQLATAIGDVR